MPLFISPSTNTLPNLPTGKPLEVMLAKPPTEKRPYPAHVPPPYAPPRGGLLPQYRSTVYRAGAGGSSYPSGGSAGGYGSYGRSGGGSAGYGSSGGMQPMIVGRGPAPAGMVMVPVMLPDGRVGYVL